MYVADLFASKRPVISMEFFPPRTADVVARFPAVVSRLCKHDPDFFTVTFGAGGSTKEGTFQTVAQLMSETGVPTVAHVAGAGLGPDDLCRVLDHFQRLGIKNLFVVRGDEAKDGSFTLHPQGFSYAGDMISFIRERYDFSIGCAGYPEGHAEAENYDRDIEFLKKKVDCGADYIVTQYFHDNEHFFRFTDKCRSLGIAVPIIPGIMPVYSLELTQRLSDMCGASIPDKLMQDLVALSDAEAQQLGIDYAYQQCQELLEHGVAGLHFYTMDRSRSLCRIIDRLRRNDLL